jgi:hypothetical protein
MKAVTDAGFQQIWSDTETRDWDLERGILRWCASPDPERWAYELRYSADGTNPTPVDIKDAVTTFEWSKFMWVSDWNPG